LRNKKEIYINLQKIHYKNITLPSAQKIPGIVYLNEAVEPKLKFLFAAISWHNCT